MSAVITQAVATVVVAAAAAYTALKPAPKAPGIKAPLAMPDQVAQEAAKRKSLAEQMARSGRASTILSDSGGTLG